MFIHTPLAFIWLMGRPKEDNTKGKALMQRVAPLKEFKWVHSALLSLLFGITLYLNINTYKKYIPPY